MGACVEVMRFTGRAVGASSTKSPIIRLRSCPLAGVYHGSLAKTMTPLKARVGAIPTACCQTSPPVSVAHMVRVCVTSTLMLNEVHWL